MESERDDFESDDFDDFEEDTFDEDEFEETLSPISQWTLSKRTKPGSATNARRYLRPEEWVHEDGRSSHSHVM